MKNDILPFLEHSDQGNDEDTSTRNVVSREILKNNYQITTEINESSTPIGNASSLTQFAKHQFEVSEKPIRSIKLSEGHVLYAWKNVANISARIIEINETDVVLDCLVDQELKQYAQMEFPIDYFENFVIHEGGYCVISYYKRENSYRCDINANPSLNLSDDFPRIEFVKNFKDSPLFNKQ